MTDLSLYIVRVSKRHRPTAQSESKILSFHDSVPMMLYLDYNFKILSRDGVIIGGFRLMTGFIGLFDTARDYTLQFTIGHTRSSQSATAFISRCLLLTSNRGRSPSSCFPNSPRPQPPASDSYSSQRLNYSRPITPSSLLPSPAYNTSARTA
jgi:hypothetical protein